MLGLSPQSSELIFRVRATRDPMAPRLPAETKLESEKAKVLCDNIHQEVFENRGWFFQIPDSPDYLLIASPIAFPLWKIFTRLNDPAKEHLKQQLIAKAGFELLA